MERVRPVSYFHFEGAPGVWENMGLLHGVLSGLLMDTDMQCSLKREKFR